MWDTYACPCMIWLFTDHLFSHKIIECGEYFKWLCKCKGRKEGRKKEKKAGYKLMCDRQLQSLFLKIKFRLKVVFCLSKLSLHLQNTLMYFYGMMFNLWAYNTSYHSQSSAPDTSAGKCVKTYQIRVIDHGLCKITGRRNTQWTWLRTQTEPYNLSQALACESRRFF